MPVCGLPQLFAQSLSGQSWREFRRRTALGYPSTATAIEAKWQAAAAMVQAWKISW